jgi:glycosyltransferase involved in cell wall biosynthesis
MPSLSQPRVAVCIPSYNRADFLPETLATLYGQNYPALTVAVLDDGSKDNTKEVIHSLQQQYPNLLYFFKPNEGEAKTVDFGFNKIKSGEIAADYFAFVNSDDPVMPGWLQPLVDAMESPNKEGANPDIAYPDWAMIDVDGNYIRDHRSFAPSLTYSLGRAIAPAGPGVLFRTTSLQRIASLRPRPYRYCGDAFTWYMLLSQFTFTHVPQVLASWRIHAGGITSESNLKARAAEQPAMMADLLDTIQSNPVAQSMRKKAMTAAYMQAGLILLKAKQASGAAYVLQALTSTPLHTLYLMGAYMWSLPPRLISLLRYRLRQRNLGRDWQAATPSVTIPLRKAA